jgi:hypothetical protein
MARRGHEPSIEAKLRGAIAAGEPGSRLVYQDWILEGGQVDDEIGDHATAPYRAYQIDQGNGAAPHRRDEMFRDVWLYERLSHQIAEVRHNPTNTTWVYAYRGLWNCVPVMVFRPFSVFTCTGGYDATVGSATTGDAAAATAAMKLSVARMRLPGTRATTRRYSPVSAG